VTVVVGTLLFSRLLLYLTWDQLALVEAKQQVLGWVLSGCTTFSLLLHHCTELKDSLLLRLLGTTKVWVGMEELVGREVMCGNGTGAALGRVKVDFACLEVEGGSGEYTVLSRSQQCYTCAPQERWSGAPPASFQVDTRYPTHLEVHSTNSSCSSTVHFEQFGVYRLDLSTCATTVTTAPVNAFLPVFWAFVLLCLLAGARLAVISVYKTAVFRRFLVWLSLRRGEGAVGDSALLLDPEPQESRKSKRVVSLDAFRGLAITIMIFVNYGGGSYYFFNHSIWNGLTVADLVFPWFMWIMGVSLVISIQSQLRSSVPRRRLAGRVVRRAATLLLLGLVMNTDGNNDLARLRIPGVLQRFGVCYLVVGVVECWRLPRQYSSPPPPLADLTSAPVQWAATILSCVLHTLITMLLPVPGCPTGYLGPGGLAENGTHWSCTGGAARWIDVSVFGEAHIYQSPTSHKIYSGVPHDPEGLLGCLTSMALVWLGAAAGRTLLVHQEWRARVTRWLLWSLLLGLAAGILCGFSLNSGPIPINKNLWSLSFVLATAAMAFFLLAAMYLLVDVWRFWSGVPLYYPGMNSILLYLGHELCSGMLPWSWRPYTQSHAELLGMNMWGCGLWVLTSYVLYRKRVFLAL